MTNPDGIFISHSPGDRSAAAALTEVFRQRGWPVSSYGSEPERVAGQASGPETVHLAGCVVVLWSVESALSETVRAQALYGAENALLVSTLIEEGVEIPPPLNSIRSVHLVDWFADSDEQAGLHHMMREVAHLMQPPAASVTPFPEARTDTAGADPPRERWSASSSPEAGDDSIDVERLRAALSDRYLIERELGSGGMATVFVAKDLIHHRQVAIKVLLPGLLTRSGTERFLREIEIAAGLSHPHIVPVHDSGEADGFLYYVMPHIEGESLRERLTREGRLTIMDTVRILREVVDALAEAHDQGVVHRDVKPDNILLWRRHAVVADFGIAKAVRDAAPEGNITVAGVSIGTPYYMAPEQIYSDETVDHRTDIYAIGVLAYELLSGHPPFSGPIPHLVLAAIVNTEPQPISKLRRDVPDALAELIMKCLRKEPDDRWQNASEMTEQLDALGALVQGFPGAGGAVRRRMAGLGWQVGSTLLVAGTLVVAGMAVFGPGSARNRGPAVTFSNIRQLTRDRRVEYQPAVSPDGRAVVYVVGLESDRDLYVQAVDGGGAVPLTRDRPGAQGLPHWTEDGSSIVFHESAPGAPSAAHIIPRLGGATRLIASGAVVSQIRGGRMIYATGDSILTRSLDGRGTVGVVAGGIAESHSPVWSPDGTRVAYVRGNPGFLDFGNISPSSIWIVDASGGEAALLTDEVSLNVSPVWLPDGQRIIFVSDRDGARDVYVTSADVTGSVRDAPERVTTGLNPHTISLSADGSVLAYSRFVFRRNVWAIAIPDTGSVSISEAREITVGNQTVEQHGVSDDGRVLVYDSDENGNQDIYILEVEGGEPQRLTRDTSVDFHPDLSPDGSEVVFYSLRHGSRDLFVITADGRSETRLTDSPRSEYHPAFGPDGLSIAFQVDQQVHVMSRDSVGGAWGDARMLTPYGGHPRWSPDGRLIVFDKGHLIGVVSTGGEESILMDGEARGLTAPYFPDWSRDGRLVYFVAEDSAGDRAVYRVPATGGRPEPMVRFDDPTKYVQLGLSVSAETLFLSVAEYESDIYVMDVEIN